jgi:hypothetical protein
MSNIMFGQLRALLAAAGGLLAGLGIVDAGAWEIVTGALLTAAAALWSAKEKLAER